MVWQQEHRYSYENFIERHTHIMYLFAVAFLFLAVRLMYLQVLRGNYYQRVSEQQRTQVIQERAPRGVIFDRWGKPLVNNRTAFVALFYPFIQEKAPPQQDLLWKVGTILQVPGLSAKIVNGWRTGQIVRLAENLSRTEMFRLQELRLVFTGISVVKEARRDYIDPYVNSHLLGYLGEINKKELALWREEGYRMGDWVGRRGIEKIYDSTLRGVDGGWELEVDALGRQTRVVRHVRSSAGNSITTTVDSELQRVAYDALQKTPTRRGAVVGIDPRTGAVRILVSSPGFDPGASLSPEFSAYLKDPSFPLFNRTAQALYPPGSIFKIVTMVAGLNDSRIEKEKQYSCNGAFQFGKNSFKCWEKKGHGRLALREAFAHSCNVYFYTIGLKIGAKPLERYARMFRLDKKTEIEDVQSEKTGLIPNEEWKREKLKEAWLPGDTINMAIGQGPLWVSPLQVAVMGCAIANRGDMYRPYIVNSIQSPTGEVLFERAPEKLGTADLKADTWVFLRDAMEAVVSEGTGGWCKFKDLPVAGKSGTAENPLGDSHGWFISYAPADNPELVLAVVVENGGGGGGVAAPIARAVYKKAFPERTKSDW